MNQVLKTEWELASSCSPEGFAAEDQIFERIYPVLISGLRRALHRYGLRRARQLELSRRDYQELVQSAADETLCRARVEIGGYDPARSPLSYWLYLLGRRVVARELGRWQGWRLEREAQRVCPDRNPKPERSPFRQVLHRDQLVRAMAGIPELQARALALFYLEDLSLPEVGEVLGRTPEAVSSLLQRARQNARDRLCGQVPRAVGRPRKKKAESIHGL